MAEDEVYQQRERVCDLGILRECYEKADGSIGFRCSAEPVTSYLSKGGLEEATAGRLCLCNSLCASAGVAQVRDGIVEAPLVTIGDDLEAVREQLPEGRDSYAAAEVIERLLA